MNIDTLFNIPFQNYNLWLKVMEQEINYLKTRSQLAAKTLILSTQFDQQIKYYKVNHTHNKLKFKTRRTWYERRTH